MRDRPSRWQRIKRAWAGEWQSSETCPWCRTNKGGSYVVWKRDPFLDVYTCDNCGGTSLWRWEMCMIYIGALEAPAPAWPDCDYYDIHRATIATPTGAQTAMRRFTVYRPNAPETHDANQKNAHDAPQFEGVIFTDGSVALRWRTACRSTSVWASFEDMAAIHGQPEYGSYFIWHDRDSDVSLAEDAERLSREGVAARTEGIAKTSPESLPNPLDLETRG